MPQNYTSWSKQMGHFMVLWGLVAMFLWACGADPDAKASQGVLKPEVMARVLSKIHLAEATLQKGERFYPDLTPTDETWIRYGQIFRDENLDWPTWKRSLEYYTSHPKKLNKVYELASAYIDELEAKLNVDSSLAGGVR